VPVIAAAVATPMASASGFAVNTIIRWTGQADFYYLDISYTNFDAVTAWNGELKWTPGESGWAEDPLFTPNSTGNTIILGYFTPGVSYTFTVTVYLAGEFPVEAYFNHTF